MQSCQCHGSAGSPGHSCHGSKLHAAFLVVGFGPWKTSWTYYIVFVLTFCCMASCPASGGIYVGMFI